MKKILLIISIFLLCMIPLKGLEEDRYVEKINVVTFDNLSSKKVNDVFYDLNVGVIEVEISLGFITKTYRVNYYSVSDLERELTKRVVSELKKEGLREEAANASIKGYKINKMTLRCNSDTLAIIKSRSNV